MKHTEGAKRPFREEPGRAEDLSAGIQQGHRLLPPAAGCGSPSHPETVQRAAVRTSPDPGLHGAKGFVSCVPLHPKRVLPNCTSQKTEPQQVQGFTWPTSQSHLTAPRRRLSASIHIEGYGGVERAACLHRPHGESGHRVLQMYTNKNKNEQIQHNETELQTHDS